jgi:hypothetical protein
LQVWTRLSHLQLRHFSLDLLSAGEYPNHTSTNQRRSANGAYSAHELLWPRLVLGIRRKKTCFRRNFRFEIPSTRIPRLLLRHVVSGACRFWWRGARGFPERIVAFCCGFGETVGGKAIEFWVRRFSIDRSNQVARWRWIKGVGTGMLIYVFRCIAAINTNREV